MKFLLFSLLLISSIAQAEDYDVDAATGYRMERYRAPVPASVPGGSTIDTSFMQAAIRDESLVLIDVYPPKGLGPDPISGEWMTPEIRETIPGSVWLPNVGRGYLEPELEDYFRRNLSRITNDDTTAPIVFFCTSDCWQSWNASVRAHRWGYTNVHWYPTGSDGWSEQGGELVVVPPVNFFNDSIPDNADFPTEARIVLHASSGESVDIGRVNFAAIDNGRYKVNVEVEGPAFNDHFLSMRPFKCIDNAPEWFCYQPYPYKLDNVVTLDDVTDLEYHLLFIKKTAKEFGIDAWNGLYFQFSKHDDGLWHGKLLEGDFNVLQSPPENDVKPIDLFEFIDADPDQRRFIEITLQPSS